MNNKLVVLKGPIFRVGSAEGLCAISI